MSSQSKATFKAIVKVARESGLLDKEIKKIEDKIIDQGLALIEQAGIDPTLLPINVRAALRGERPNIDYTKLLSPPVICAMPQLTAQQKEITTRTINNAREEVEQIYTTTNAIKEQTIALTSPIISLQNSASSVATTVESVSTLLEVLKKLLVPTAVAGVGVPTGVLNTFSSTIGSLSDLVKAASVDIRVIPNALGIMTATINTTIAGLNGLNLILDPFLKILTFIKSVVDLQDQCPLLNQSDIDNVQSLLLSDITGNLAQADLFAGIGNNLEERLQLNSDDPYFYKNFLFTLESDPNNPYFFPSRRIRCFRQNSVGFTDGQNGGGNVTIYNINELTNPLLPAESYSYASSLSVLVAEGRFAVDTYTDNIKIFSAPVFRENVDLISESSIDLGNLDTAELEELAASLGIDLETLTQSGTDILPDYIIYGGNRVNLNSSPTDVEYGADALVNDGSYQGGTGLTRSSYIQSGTIQVNKPISLRLRTFGGTGNPIPNNVGVSIPRYTQALLTIKRSSAIQDDINPFTGRIEGWGPDVAASFLLKYGQGALTTLENVNTTAQETGTGLYFGTGNEGVVAGDDAYQAGFANADFTALNYTSTFLEQLKYSYEKWYGVGVYSGDGQDKSDNTRKVIDVLFAKSQQLLYNDDVLWLSKRLFGNKDEFANIRTSKFKRLVKNLDGKIALDINQDAVDAVNSGVFGVLQGYAKFFSFGKDTLLDKIKNDQNATANENWYWTARKNTTKEGLTGEDQRESSDRQNAKAATLGMLYYGLRQFQSEFTKLYGDRTEYNNGAWISPATGLPLIPGNVGPDNNDITLALQVSQTAQAFTEINDIVGSLEILGTYTYDLEIIDSNPQIGGVETNFPTNYTFFTVEDITN